MSNSSDPISVPLVHEGDSYILEVEVLSEKGVRLHRIIRYALNQNSAGTHESFWGLDQRTREVILRQIQRRFQGRQVKL